MKLRLFGFAPLAAAVVAVLTMASPAEARCWRSDYTDNYIRGQCVPAWWAEKQIRHEQREEWRRGHRHQHDGWRDHRHGGYRAKPRDHNHDGRIDWRDRRVHQQHRR